MAVNRVAYFFAGVVLGAAGMAMVKSGKGKQLLAGAVNSGTGVVETVLTKVETIKEDIEDYVAEVKYNAATAKEPQVVESSDESSGENDQTREQPVVTE